MSFRRTSRSNRFAMDRRRFLGAAAGAGLWAATPGWAAAATNPDVVVIGAGAAGLAAAKTLQALGKSVVIVEAMNRIGGRALTDKSFFGVPFDIGCAWIHAGDRNPFKPMADQWGWTLEYHDMGLDEIYFGKRRAKPSEVEAERKTEEDLIERIAEIGETRDVPSSEVLQPGNPLHEAASTYLGPMDMAVDLDELSTTDYGQSADLDPNYYTLEGFGALIARYGEGAPVTLEAPVRKIRLKRREVEVLTDKGKITAKAAIVTVSTGVLANGSIAFEPGLPAAKEAAMAEVPMGLLTKIPLMVRGDRFGVEPFEDVLLERAGRRDLYFFAWPFNVDVIVGFVGGDFAWELASAGEAEAIAFAKEGLAHLFGSKAPGRVEKALMTNWHANPWTRGAYAAAMPGRFAARAEIARPIENKIFFAGEALAGEFIQTAGGAYLSGEAVAKDVARLIG